MGGSGNHMEQGTTGGCPYDVVGGGALAITPNHIHGIIVLVGAAPRGRPNIRENHVAAHGPAAPDTGSGGRHDAGLAQGMGWARAVGQPQGVAPTMSLADVVYR